MIAKLKIFLEWFVEWFVFITTGILIICAINFSFSSDREYIPRATLLQILLSALLTAGVTAVFSMAEPIKKCSVVFGMLLHFSCLTGIMILCGGYFGWIGFGLPGIIQMIVSVAIVYVFVVAFYYIMDKHRAEQINRRLREKYKDEEL